MAGAPYEQKYNVLKKALTYNKGRYQELKDETKLLRRNNYELYADLRNAMETLFKLGYRRLPDGTWTSEPYVEGEE